MKRTSPLSRPLWLWLSLLATLQEIQSQSFVPLSLGPDFQAAFGESDILRGFKVNTAQGENTLKSHVFQGTVRPIPQQNTFLKSEIIQSAEELREMMEIEGSLSVSYGPMISGKGAGSFLENKVSSRRSATILYRIRRAAYARSVDVSTLVPVSGVANMRTDQIAELYGTRFIDQMLYGAQLDVVFQVTSAEDIDFQEIEAELKDRIGVGLLSIEFSAKLKIQEGQEKADLQMNIEARASGVSVSVPPNPTLDEVNDLIKRFNDEYDQLQAYLSDLDNIEDEGNVLNQFTPVGFTLSSIADRLPNKFDSATLAYLDMQMEHLWNVMESAFFWRSRLIAELNVQAGIYTDPRQRDEIFAPLSGQVDKATAVLESKIQECLVYRRLPLADIVGMDGNEPAALPEMYPKDDYDEDFLQGLTGEIYLPSPVTIGTTTFPEFHYVGFAIPTSAISPSSTPSFTPWTSGVLRRDSDNSVVARSETTPDVLEQIGYAVMKGMPVDPELVDGGGSDAYVRYGEPTYLQVNSMDNRWLSGSRNSIGLTATRNALDNEVESDTMKTTYEWLFRSRMVTEGIVAVEDDPKYGIVSATAIPSICKTTTPRTLRRQSQVGVGTSGFPRRHRLP